MKLINTEYFSIIPVISIFDALCVMVEVVGQNLAPRSNKKLDMRGGDFQVTILPVECLERDVFVGRGAVVKQQLTACGHQCEFKSKQHGTVYGGCYVNYLHDKEVKARKAHQCGDVVKVSSDSFGRFTTWGDIGRLNYKAQSFLAELTDMTRNHTTYISDFHTAPLFRETALASVQTREHVSKALLWGWKTYTGTPEARDALLEQIEPNEKIFYCPVKGDGLDPYGCRQCHKCDGSRHVVAYTVGRP